MLSLTSLCSRLWSVGRSVAHRFVGEMKSGCGPAQNYHSFFFASPLFLDALVIISFLFAAKKVLAKAAFVRENERHKKLGKRSIEHIHCISTESIFLYTIYIYVYFNIQTTRLNSFLLSSLSGSYIFIQPREDGKVYCLLKNSIFQIASKVI